MKFIYVLSILNINRLVDFNKKTEDEETKIMQRKIESQAYKKSRLQINTLGQTAISVALSLKSKLSSKRHIGTPSQNFTVQD